MTEMANIEVAALTPTEMVPAQHDLIGWCGRKIQALADERDELELHQKLALENGWKTSVVNANVSRTVRRIKYYEKMRAALQAGYLLVPNMPCDILAVRVNRDRQPKKETERSWYSFAAKPMPQLPAGEGRYVDDTLTRSSYEYDEAQKDGKVVTKTVYRSEDYDEVDFPIDMAVPVMGAAARAMALKVFDQIGLVRNGREADPILLGQLLDPRGNNRLASFFIGWYVNTETL